MDDQQQQTVLKSVAISSGLGGGGVSSQDMQMAFRVLEEFKAFEGKIPVCIGWLHQERLVLENVVDVTVPAKLFAASLLETFLVKGYARLGENDRLALRHAVLVAARQVAPLPASEESSRILGNKLAVLLAGLMVRDFPQRWTTFFQDVFSPQQQGGGLWADEAGEGYHVMGVKMCLECLRLVAEDCTDSDFNAKISTSRRNDVLIGLNEVSGSFLPLLFKLLEHYSFLVQTKTTLHNMRTYLLSAGRKLKDMTPEEASMYQAELQRQNVAAKLIGDCLVTMARFCHSMPLEWILGKKHGDFGAAFLHLLREPSTQVQAVVCLEQLSIRKLEPSQWYQMLTDVPPAVRDANQAAVAEQEQRRVEQEASGAPPSTQQPDDLLTTGLPFHRALAKMLAHTVSTNVTHVTNDKQMMKGKGERFETFTSFLRLLVDLLHHPSGRICGEQINTWIALLRDPQFSKLDLLEPFAEEILNCYMDHVVRIRWEDVEEGRHPHAGLIEASWDDEDEYDTWIADIRSKTSQLFKFLGHVEPKTAATVVNIRLQKLLNQYGSGEPRDHLEPSNNQLTPKSEACMKFEGMHQPLENILSGLPSWALHENGSSSQKENESRTQVRGALSQAAMAIVSWNPTYIWLKFRRATLLDSLKHYWKHDASTLLQGVDSLLGYMNAPDDWTVVKPKGPRKFSGEIIGLRKKSGIALVSIAKRVPHHLVPWLSQLSEATRRLLSSEELLPPNRMHLYEFLSCVATAVDDPIARARFVADVLADALDLLDSPEVKQTISSVEAFLTALGIMGARTDPSIVTNPASVARVTNLFVNLFSAFNQLLSVGKRCHEAAKKRPNGGLPMQSMPNLQGDNLNFPDEGPIDLSQLAMNDPFIPLWPRILPSLLQVIDVALKVWHPSIQAALLPDSIQRYAFAISDDEAYMAKVQENKKSGGVFGEGGTAGSVVKGTDRRDENLVPRWSGWLNELRNTCFQLLGLIAGQRALYAPEISTLYPKFVSIVVNQEHLRAMEHRHLIQLMKQFLEILLLSCPSTLYGSHLAPLLRPILEHMQVRLQKAWDPITRQELAGLAKPLFSGDCRAAAELASRGGDDWFTPFYARSGVFVGDLDPVTAEAAVDKFRVDLSRTYSDVLQAALALKGDWALVLATQAKEEQATKKNDPSKLKTGPRTRVIDKNGNINADGTPKIANQVAIDARKKLRIDRMCHFMLLEDEAIAGYLTLSVIQCLGYPDAYTVRRCARICHRILETVAWSTRYTDLLGNKLFVCATKNIVTEPKWMVGIEWDMINLIRDIYCRLVLGQALLPGGQGPGMQQPKDAQNPGLFEQAKTAERPLQGGGIVVAPSPVPKNLLASLPGISPQDVEKLSENMTTKLAAKEQKDFLRDLLRVAADNTKHMDGGRGENGVFDRAVAAESLLNQKTAKVVSVPDIPEKLVTHSMVKKQQEGAATTLSGPEGLSAFQL